MYENCLLIPNYHYNPQQLFTIQKCCIGDCSCTVLCCLQRKTTVCVGTASTVVQVWEVLFLLLFLLHSTQFCFAGDQDLVFKQACLTDSWEPRCVFGLAMQWGRGWDIELSSSCRYDIFDEIRIVPLVC